MSNLSGVSVVASHVFVSTLIASWSASASGILSSLYSCFISDIADCELAPMQYAFHPP